MAENPQRPSAYDALKIAENDFVLAKEAYDDALIVGDKQRAAKLMDFLRLADEKVLTLAPLAAKEENNRRAPILQKLADGTYADKPLVPPPGLPAQEQHGNRLRNTLAELYRTSPDNVDISSGGGVSFSTRAAMSLAREPSQKYRILRDALGDANISPVSIKGKQNFVIRKPNGGIVLVDEVGASTGDIADVAADIVRTTGEAALTIAASAVARRPVAASAFTAGASNLVLGGTQRVGANALSSQELDIVDEFMAQVPEAIVMGGTDYAATKVFSMLPMNRWLAKKSPNEHAKSIDDAVQRLTKKGVISEPGLGAAMRSPDAMAKEQFTAGLYPTKTLGKARAKTLQDLGEWQKALLDGTASPPNEFAKVLNRIQGETDVIFEEIRKSDSALARVAKDMYEQRAREFVTGRFDATTLGESLLGIVKRAEASENALKNAAWEGFFKKSNVEVPPDEAFRVFKEAADEAISKGLENPAVSKVVKRLEIRAKNTKELADIEAMIASGKPVEPEMLERAAALRNYSGPLDLEMFKNYMDRIGDPIPASGAIAQGTPVRAAAIASNKVNKYWNDMLAANGLDAEFAAINKKYKEDVLLFKRNSVGAIAKEHLGDAGLAPASMVQSALRDSRSVDDILRAVAMDDPKNAPAILGSLQRAYLEKIGLTDTTAGATSFNYDKPMLAALWGRQKDGSVSPVVGDMMANKLDRLAVAFKKSNIPPEKLTPDDINELAGITVSASARDSAIRRITARASRQVEAEAFLGKKLLDAAERGKLHLIDNDEFAKALMKGRAEQVTRVMRVLPEAEKKTARMDFVARMMNEYRSGPNSTRMGKELWDADKLLRDFARNPTKEKNARIVLGDEFVDDLKAASVVQRTVAPANSKQTSIELRGSYVPGGDASLYSITPITQLLKHRLLAMGYGSGILQSMMRRSALQGVPIDPDEGVRRMIKYGMTTVKGTETLFEVGRNDPQFREQIAEISGTLTNEEREFQEFQGKFNPSAK